MTKLKACPFCRGKKINTHNLNWIRQWVEMAVNEPWWAECEKCHARSGSYETEEEAIEAWNRREK